MTGLLARALEAAPAPSGRLEALLFSDRRPSWVRTAQERSGALVSMNIWPPQVQVRYVFVPDGRGGAGGGMRA